MNVHLVRSVLRRPSVSSHISSTSFLRTKSGLNGSNASSACFISSLMTNGSLSSSSSSLNGYQMSDKVQQQRLADSGRRTMSSTDNDEPPSSAAEELSDLLARELTEEEDNESTTTMPADLKDLKTQIEENWRIVQGIGGDDEATIKLVRKEGGPPSSGKISIVFHCQDTVDGEDDEHNQDDVFDEDEGEQAVAVRFTVTATKAGKTMVLMCTSEDAEARVESVALTDADAETVVTNGLDGSLYQGPEFTELAADVQEAFHKYVQTECGVDGDVAAFISMYADYKEQSEYVRWLKQVQGMIR